MNRTFAGIGTRELPEPQWNSLSFISGVLAMLDYELNSGGAGGSDQACEEGCDLQGGTKHIYLPWNRFKTTDKNGELRIRTLQEPGCVLITDQHIIAESLRIAAQFHPYWNNLKDPARMLMARNSFQVLGADLQTPVDFVLTYTGDGQASGGTGQAIRIAHARQIPVYNIYNKTDNDALKAALGVHE